MVSLPVYNDGGQFYYFHKMIPKPTDSALILFSESVSKIYRL